MLLVPLDIFFVFIIKGIMIHKKNYFTYFYEIINSSIAFNR